MKLTSFVNFVLESGVPIKHWQKNLSSFKGIHKGKKCILIGNGPSVTYGDLEKIDGLDCIKFVFNRFHKVYTSLKFTPDYTLSINPLFIDDFYDELINEHKGELFVGHHKTLANDSKYNWFKIKTNEEFEFSDNPIKFVEPGGSVVVAALQIAYFMGCRDFFVYGIDHSFSKNENNNRDTSSTLAFGEGNHFIKNYRSDKAWCPPNTELIEQAFLKSKLYIEANGGHLINISRRTQLNVLPKLGFDEFFNRLNHKHDN